MVVISITGSAAAVSKVEDNHGTLEFPFITLLSAIQFVLNSFTEVSFS